MTSYDLAYEFLSAQGIGTREDVKALALEFGRIRSRATDLRDTCMAEMSRCARDPDLIADRFDPGDARVDIEGNPYNVLTVLYILNAIGTPGCRAR